MCLGQDGDLVGEIHSNIIRDKYMNHNEISSHTLLFQEIRRKRARQEEYANTDQNCFPEFFDHSFRFGHTDIVY